MSSLTVYAPQITILDNVVNMIDGLYSLNDLHRASGGEVKHKPAFFLRNEQTKEIVTELHISNSPENTLRVKRGGTNQGTWVCKELVYSYAMWISAKFHIAVVRTFDKLVTGELKVQPSRFSTVADRKHLNKAVNFYCAKTGSIQSEIWKMVHQRFNIEDVYEMTLEQVPQAIEYVHGFILQAKQIKEVEVNNDNEFWRYVGIIKHQELTQALNHAKDVMSNLHKVIGSAQNHTSLIYDAFGEQQRQSGLGKDGHQEAYIKAQEFVDKQDKLMAHLRF